MRRILIAGLIICMLAGLGSAGVSTSSGYSFNGDGTPTYPNEGFIWGYVTVGYEEGGLGSSSFGVYTDEYDALGHTVNYTYTSNAYACSASDPYAVSSTNKAWQDYPHGSSITLSNAAPAYDTCASDTDERLVQSSTDITLSVSVAATGTFGIPGMSGTAYNRVTISYNPLYNISGNATCLSYANLTNSDGFIEQDDLSDDYYDFKNLIDGNTYTLIFSDAHEYEFTVDGSDIVYNYDGCSHTKYRFEELCGNLIPDSEGWLCADEPTISYCTDWYAANGIYDLANSSITTMKMYTDTFIGQTGWIIDPVVDGTEYTLTNPNIAWNLKVIVQNESDGTLIDGAMVKVDQTCYCTLGYSTRQKMTVNGMVEFGDMSLQDASLFVMKSGYKICDENSTGYSAFLSGRANFSSKTWIVKMAPSWSNNTTTFYETGNKVDIHFRNGDGNRTSQILDTDTEVYLYYENNNSNEEAMTLKFQSSSTHSYFIDEDSWAIAHDDIGHKTIPQADFTPWTYAYRAVIYNSSIYGWNLTIPLTVRNETKEETLHYENLTTNLWFRHEADGKIDYREDMQIVSHAISNNTTLMNIDLEVWKNGALLCYDNLTATDYAGVDCPYFYVYEPVYEYVPGSNYTAKMYGFDRTLLEVRYLECINDTITRKNKLTIGVKDRTGANLDNCYVYLEGWGSLPTGTTYYNSYEGIDNGYYRYKASKSGYSGDGWSDVTILGDDEIVWYTLTEDYTNASATQQKLTDDDIKAMFFPLMFFLLICIIFGGFKYVTD